MLSTSMKREENDLEIFRRVDTVFLPVRDLDRAIAWYTQTFGFTLRWKQGNYAAMNISETPLTLYQPEAPFQPVTQHSPFNFYTPDLDAAHARLKECGASVKAIDRHPDFGFFEFHDPDGNLLGVCWFPEA